MQEHLVVHSHFNGEDKYTTKESDRLFKQNLFYGVSEEERDDVCNKKWDFLK